MGAPLLDVRHLTTSFLRDGRHVPAITDVTFTVGPAETLAIVGESGCGKSVTALSVMRLLDEPAAKVDSGAVYFAGTDLLGLSERQMVAIRGGRMAMVFQEPMTSLNPVFTVGFQLTEAIRLHRPLSRTMARQRAEQLLELVRVPAAATRLDAYPHQLSGGMRQRVMIAMALACNPELLIADEPTTALDVTVQAQVLGLLAELQERLAMATVLITHDLGLVAEFARRVLVMYAGEIVEESPVLDLLRSPLHPYTDGLLSSLPARVLSRTTGSPPRRLPAIEGMVPSMDALPDGCRFFSRCTHWSRHKLDPMRCRAQHPALAQLHSGRSVRCHYPISDSPS